MMTIELAPSGLAARWQLRLIPHDAPSPHVLADELAWNEAVPTWIRAGVTYGALFAKDEGVFARPRTDVRCTLRGFERTVSLYLWRERNPRRTPHRPFRVSSSAHGVSIAYRVGDEFTEAWTRWLQEASRTQLMSPEGSPVPLLEAFECAIILPAS